MSVHPALEQRLMMLSAGTVRRRRDAAAEFDALAAQADWSILIDQLRVRRLLPLLGPRLLELVGEQAGDRFAATVAEALEHSRRQGTFLQMVAERLTSTLAARGIRCTVLKGAALSQALYGDPGRRPSSDIDLLVASERLSQAAAVVREMGYRAPSDYLDERGLPRLHLTLIHEREQLPPVEIHWRIHWYEQSFARERLLAPVGDPEWRPAPIDEMAALLLFYARDGFLDLRHATDLSEYWEVCGADLPRYALDETIQAYPQLEHALLAAATVAEKTVGLPLDRLTERAAKLRLRDRVAVRLADPHLYASQAQLYANIALIDGLLSPPGGLRAFVRRQVIPPRDVLNEQAKKALLPKASSPVVHSVRVLGRYGLAMSRLHRTAPALNLTPGAANVSGRWRR
jgi:hypothetical protein